MSPLSKRICTLDAFTRSLVEQGIVKHDCSPAGCGRLPRQAEKPHAMVVVGHSVADREQRGGRR